MVPPRAAGHVLEQADGRGLVLDELPEDKIRVKEQFAELVTSCRRTNAQSGQLCPEAQEEQPCRTVLVPLSRDDELCLSR